MEKRMEKLLFASDYQEGAHPEILKRLAETNFEKSAGYGLDAYSEAAREKIRAACRAPEAEIHFLVGGTQANAVVISALLRPYQGVVAAETGHVGVHEAGAIECGGHKVLTLPQKDGKISAAALRAYLSAWWADENRDHMVMPGMVYLSHPTEYGTLYSLSELTAIHAVCREYRIPLYVDGARLAYALGCGENDVTLPDLARLADAFYIGGTKCGALFGEAVVFPVPDTVPHFFTIVKQHGALLAKGRIAGIQFDTLFTDDLYVRGGRAGIRAANRIREALLRKGYRLSIPSPTNQIFLTLDQSQLARLSGEIEMAFFETLEGDCVMMRIATSWATTDEEVEELISRL